LRHRINPEGQIQIYPTVDFDKNNSNIWKELS
jgi:hypothetical protein